MNRKKNFDEKIYGWMFIVISIVVSIIYIITACNRSLTDLENVLLQVISLCLGIAGSFLLGRESTNDAAKNIIKPYARSAFRRLISLAKGLSRITNEINISKDRCQSDSIPVGVLDKIAVMVLDQVYTADDAIEDWRDIVPEEIDEMYNKLENVLREKSI